MADNVEPAQTKQVSIRPSAKSRSLQELLCLGKKSSCNTVLVAIDFENHQNVQRHPLESLPFEVGLAILDTADLDSVHPTDLITTHHFISGPLRFQKKASGRYRFGESTIIPQNGALKSIYSVIPFDRPIVLVGHDIHNELKGLEILGFDFASFNITTLDTQRLAKKMDSRGLFSLRQLLIALDCPFTRLHCGGNDANFTLKALLLMTVRDFERECARQTGSERRLAVLKETALHPWPGHDKD